LSVKRYPIVSHIEGVVENLAPKIYTVFIILKAKKHFLEEEIRDLLPLEKLAEKGLELIKISVVET